MDSLFALIDRLRGEGGCPWDRRQRPESLKKYLLLECDELARAIEAGDAENVQEECGDLLFILAFLVRLYEEEGAFSWSGVLAELHAKMVRRHPHVFLGTPFSCEEDLKRQWAAIKAQEKVARVAKNSAKNSAENTTKQAASGHGPQPFYLTRGSQKS